MKNNKHINKEIITFDTIEAYQKKRFEGLYASSKIVNLRKYVSIDKIIEFGCLVGISGKFFNPKMSSFLVSNYRGRNPQFDVAKTIAFLDRAYKAINNSAKEGKKILIVGTVGDIVKKHIKEEAERVGCFYINQR
jgi:small subunit ribosomal protein S2